MLFTFTGRATRHMARNSFISGLLLAAVLGAPTAARAQCAQAWVPGIGTPGLNNQVSALTVAPSGEVFVGGQFTTANGILSNGLARYQPTTSTWRSSPWGSTFALATSPGGDVLVGGSTAIGTDGSYNIGKFDTDLPSVTPRSPLYFGLGGAGTAVNAIVQLPGALGDVFAGGNFTSAAPSLTAFRIARYSHTTGRWSNLPNPLGDGTSGPVNALALSPSGDVILGGAFAGVGLTAGASRIASYSPTTGAWSALGAGVNGDVNALAVLPSGEVFAGGAFTIAGGNAANRVARYNPTTNTWSALGAGTDGVVSALRLLADGDLLVGGTFTSAGGVPASNIARYSPATNTWSALGAGTNGAVRAFAILPGGDVIIGGAFTSAGGSTANRIARYSPGTAAPIITTQPQPVVTVTGNSRSSSAARPAA
ncbi:MAG: hypothetical protein SFY96_11255 [Planctomycetota bacterium]|nr:hypothetical protein [Planctomycetota bacterium]